MGVATKNVNPWVVGAVIFTAIAGNAAYAYQRSGLPIICYKDNQQFTLSPGGGNKLVSYSWSCRKELFGIDFGPFGWAATGLELIPVGDELSRRGFPPGTMITYLEKAKTELNRELSPPVKVVWKESTHIQIYYSPLSEVVSRGGMRSYAVQFIKEGTK